MEHLLSSFDIWFHSELFFSFKKISEKSGSLLKKLEIFGLVASKDLEVVMEAMMEALVEAMEVPARELGRAAAVETTNGTY